MVLPIPHKLPAATWHVEQGIFSSFLRTGRNANIPIQLNFTALDHDADFIEIAKGTPMIQYCVLRDTSHAAPTGPRD
eukprot:m.284854 g.284854  ORF g.284854 m.284854 type:complete len:77 (+) comp19914_c0_seq5:1263-1493(+)